MANSSFVAARVRRYYGRDAEVVHPPVDLNAFRLSAPARIRDYYLFVSELVRYKRADLVIEAFRRMGSPLIIVGDGEERRALEKTLPANVRMLGRVSAGDLPALFQGARALVFPAEEDFGIVPVEAMACGTPVIAYRRGGALDSVVDGKTGLFFDRQDPASLIQAILRFEEVEAQFRPGVIAGHAAKFSAARFREQFAAVIRRALSDQSSCSAKSSNREGISDPV